MGRKALVLDIDGTLANSQKEITEATKEAIIRIMEEGHKVILASGRPTPGMRKYEKELKLDKYGSYLLSYNGAKVVESRTGEIVYQRTLAPTFIPRLYAYAKEKGCGLITYLGNEIISAFEPDEFILLESKMNNLPVRHVVNFPRYMEYAFNKCLMTAPPEQAAEIEKDMQDKFGNSLSIYRSEPFFIEVMPKNMNKATALAEMLKVIGISPEDTICCGDGYNDVAMLQFAGVAVAMGNAQPGVKEMADFVTGTNDEDGLVQVIEKFIL